MIRYSENKTIPDTSKVDESALKACTTPKLLYKETTYPLVKKTILKEDIAHVDEGASERDINYTIVHGYLGVTSDHRALIRIAFRKEDEEQFNEFTKEHVAHITVTDNPNIV